jgi:hypothetical protein
MSLPNTGYAPALLAPSDIRQDNPLTVNLVKGGTVQGNVFTNDGQGGDFTVRLRMHPDTIDANLSSHNAFKLEYSTKSNEQGHFAFRRLTPGKYYISLLYVSKKYGQRYGHRIPLEISDSKVTKCNLQAESNPFSILQKLEDLD